MSCGRSAWLDPLKCWTLLARYHSHPCRIYARSMPTNSSVCGLTYFHPELQYGHGWFDQTRMFSCKHDLDGWVFPPSKPRFKATTEGQCPGVSQGELCFFSSTKQHELTWLVGCNCDFPSKGMTSKMDLFDGGFGHRQAVLVRSTILETSGRSITTMGSGSWGWCQTASCGLFLAQFLWDLSGCSNDFFPMRFGNGWWLSGMHI